MTDKTETYTEAVEKMLTKQEQSLRNDLKELEVKKRRMKFMLNILETLPQKVKGRSLISVSGWGNRTYVQITSRYKSFTEHDTIAITQWCANQDRWEFEKRLDTYSGDWRHILTRRMKDWSAHYEIEFTTINNVDGCEVVEIVETREVKTFKVNCPE